MIQLLTVKFPISISTSKNEGKNALTVAIIARERECARAIIESDGWLDALKTDVPDALGSNSPRETPLR